MQVCVPDSQSEARLLTQTRSCVFYPSVFLLRFIVYILNWNRNKKWMLQTTLTGGGLRPRTAALNNSPACVGSHKGWKRETSSTLRLTELRWLLKSIPDSTWIGFIAGDALEELSESKLVVELPYSFFCFEHNVRSETSKNSGEFGKHRKTEIETRKRNVLIIFTNLQLEPSEHTSLLHFLLSGFQSKQF